MEVKKLLNLANDGLNMVCNEGILYIRCKRDFLKYSFEDKKIITQNTIFKKDGKSRSFSVCGKLIICTDFCDLYIIDKENLETLEVMHLGQDLSSDLGVVRYNQQNAYINIRNGKMAVLDLNSLKAEKYEICDESSWEHCVVENRIYTGTVNGNLIETDADHMLLLRKVPLCKKNIYGILSENGYLYTVSQDMSIKAVNAETLECIASTPKAVKGMARIVGIHKNSLIIACNDISLWDKHTLQLQQRIDMPTGLFNKGTALFGDAIIGSNFESIFTYSLN